MSTDTATLERLKAAADAANAALDTLAAAKIAADGKNVPAAALANLAAARLAADVALSNYNKLRAAAKH